MTNDILPEKAYVGNPRKTIGRAVCGKRAARSLAAGILLAATSAFGVSLNDYVQDGLVALYDGTFNNITAAGVTNHDASVQTWHNLVTGQAAPLSTGSVTVNGNSYSFTDQGSFFSETIPGLSNAVVTTGLTIELVSEYTSLSQLGIGTRVGTLGPYYQSGKLTYSMATGQLGKWLNPAAAETVYAASFVYPVTYDISGTKAYLNGELRTGDREVTWKAAYAPGDLVKVGNYSPSHSAVGKIYTVRIYNRQLTADEIAVNANVDRARYGTPSPIIMEDAVWTGSGADDNLSTTGNFAGADPDFSTGAVRPTVAASDAAGRTVTVDGAYALHGIAFSGAAARFGTERNAADAAVRLGASGIDVIDALNPATQRHVVDVPIAPYYNQTWSFDATNTTVELLKPLGLDFEKPLVTVTKSGRGKLWLRGGPATFAGTFNVATGYVYATGNEPFGPSATVRVFAQASKGTALLFVSNAVISSTLELKGGDGGRTALQIVGGTTNVFKGPIKTGNVDTTLLAAKSHTVFAGGYGTGYSCLSVAGTLVISNQVFKPSTWEGSSSGLTVFCCPSNSPGSMHQWISSASNPLGVSWCNGATFNFRMEADRALWTESKACLNGSSTWDLNGYDIQIGTLWAAKGCKIRSFGGPALMRIRQQESGSLDLARLVNAHTFMGELSIYKYGTGTLNLSGMHTATGCVTVATGELCFTNSASWAMATNVIVKGSATIRAYNASVFGKTTELTIGETSDDTAAYAFGKGETAVAGVQTVNGLVLNGVRQAPGRFYTAVGNPGGFAGAVETPRITGNGAIYVRSYGTVFIFR